MEKIYIVSYSTGEYEDYREHNIFATFDKKEAFKYVKRFNSLIDKWYNHYSQYNGDYRWIKDEFADKYFPRWYMLHELNDCFYKEIKVRN